MLLLRNAFLWVHSARLLFHAKGFKGGSAAPYYGAVPLGCRLHLQRTTGINHESGNRRNLLILLAPRPGFEPGTCPLGGGRAIQLCHRGVLSGAPDYTALRC